MPIDKVCIYRLLFFVCLYGYGFLPEDKAIGVKVCTVVHQGTGQEISQFVEL